MNEWEIAPCDQGPSPWRRTGNAAQIDSLRHQIPFRRPGAARAATTCEAIGGGIKQGVIIDRVYPLDRNFQRFPSHRAGRKILTATPGSRFHFGDGEMTEGVDAGQRLMAEARPRRDERSAKRRSPYKLVPRQPLPGHPAPGRGSELTSEQSRPADESMDEPAGVSPVRVAVARKGRRDRSILKPGGHRERGNALRSFVLARQKKPSR